MTPWLDDGDVRLYHGDALEQLREMPSESVHCLVTSPPFWGLRDYGTGSWAGGDEDCDHDAERIERRQSERQAGLEGGTPGSSRDPIRNSCKCGAARVDQQIGLEETPDEWCARLVTVMREARRVLRSDGVCWIEVGDTYASGGHNGKDFVDGGKTQMALAGERYITHAQAGVKQKDLVGAPWMLAFALRADGWYLRSDTIWARPNPMPESVTDRPTKAHSYVFLLTKSARYYYDADAIREQHSEPQGRTAMVLKDADRYRERDYKEDATGNGRSSRMQGPATNPAGRNARSVWSIPTEPTPFAHFATFPQALVERCIKAGTSEHGACSECGAPWRRITERGIVGAQVGNNAREDDPHGGRNNREGFAGKAQVSVSTLGWDPPCECFERNGVDIEWFAPEPDPSLPVPCVVLDPFMGSGTTALVARRLGRHALGVELNESYLRISAKRLEQLSLLTGDAT